MTAAAVGGDRARPPALRPPVSEAASGRRLVVIALGVAVFVGIAQAILSRDYLAHGMVDTDDAMRLVMVRGLLAGQGWFDVFVARVQPPLGLLMHWSRLIDGGIAGLVLLFRTVLPPAAAETAATDLWPVLWAFPATLAALVAANRLGGVAAVFVCLLFLLLYQPAFVEFRPGRIDHDNVQIALTMIAFAGALNFDRGQWGAVAAGAGTGLLLNIGLEALPFAALLGVGIGVRAAVTPALAPALRRYALALTASVVGLYVAQTAPALLLRPACDQIGVNLVAGLVAATAGLAVLGGLAPRLPHTAVRLAGLALVGGAALATYLGIHPACIGGPFGDVDPRLFSLWLDHVDEMQPLAATLHDHPRVGIAIVAGPLAALVSLAFALGRRPAVRRDPSWLLAAAALLGAALMTVYAARSGGYALWFALPVMAASLARMGILAGTPSTGGVPAMTGLASPLVASVLAVAVLAIHVAASIVAPEPAVAGIAGPSSCTTAGAFRQLAALPPALVGGDVDLGSFVLLYTQDDVLGAPYHRAAPGILKSLALMAATPDRAAALASADGLAYLAHCTPSPPGAAAPDSLGAALDANHPPDWLAPVSAAGGLRVYRVTAPALRGSEP